MRMESSPMIAFPVSEGKVYLQLSHITSVDEKIDSPKQSLVELTSGRVVIVDYPPLTVQAIVNSWLAPEWTVDDTAEEALRMVGASVDS